MDAASIESMNKVRKSLGLPLLPVPGAAPIAETDSNGPRFKQQEDGEDEEPASTLDTREAAGFANFQAIQDAERKRIEREQRKRAVQAARDKAARFQKLEGRGLGEIDDAEDTDAKAWLKGQKKRQRDIEKQRQQQLEEELAERERLASIQYTEADLKGIQVAHAVGDFDDGIGEQILTLQDQEIGQEGDSETEDVLENADIVAKDKTNERLELKKRKAYDVNEEQQGLLSQYDDKKRKAFTLDGQGNSIEEREAKKLQVGEQLRNTINLDMSKPEPISDYQEIKMKKPKKTKKNKRQKDEDEDDILPSANGDTMEVDTVEPRSKAEPDAIFNDDEDLANALSFSRRAALKKKKQKPEDFIKQIKKEEESTPAPEEGGLTLDDTTTFLANLSNRPQEEQQAVQQSIERELSPDSREESPDHVMQDAHAVTEDEEALLERLRREQSTHTPDATHNGLEEEKTVEQGLGAALNLLRQRGLVKGAEDPMDKNKLYRDRQKFILEARLREHDNEARARQQRERDRQSGKLQHMSVREREEHARWQNTQREHQSSIAAAAAFNKEYKPDVQIKYVDDDGRLMNQKEAFKHLSHQFHGKGSGKGKTEKHLKKVADEKRRESRSVLDANADMARGYEGAAQHQRKGKEAGVRLQ